jgi:NAD-dependent deacetylase
MTRLPIEPGTRVLVLTGAGVSAESGIPTFRGVGGLWNGVPVQEVASPEGFRADALRVWRFYSERREAMAGAQPNAGHRALASLEERLGDDFLLVTQNIDGLHSQAGSKRVIELHGNLFQTRCVRCNRAPFADPKGYPPEHLPACGQCHARGEFAPLRPSVVWFGERLDPTHLERIERFLRAARKGPLHFLAVGTSGQVSPAAELVQAARTCGGRTWLVNAEAPRNAEAFDQLLLGQSGNLLPNLLAS